MPSILNARMIGMLSVLYTRTVTIQSRNDTPGANGQMTPNWTNVPGCVNIACSMNGRQGKEVRRPDGTISDDSNVIYLNGIYPMIDESMQAVMDDGTKLDILHIYTDQFNIVTKMDVELIK